jgi:hypothetical protein
MNRIFISTNGSRLARAECSANDQWTVEFLLEDKKVTCFAADPLNPNVVYAGTRDSGVLRSEDRGKTWQPCGMDGQIVKSIAVSAAQPDLIVAGTKPPGVFISRDGGQQWTESESFQRKRRWYWFTPGEPGAPYVQGIALSPTDPNVMLAGVELGAVLRSADGGKTWAGHLNGAVRDCHTLTFHATDGNWVYEGGGTSAAFSRDGGATWRQPDRAGVFEYFRLMLTGGVRRSGRGLDRRYGWAVGADSARPDVWYVSAAPGPFKAHVEGKAEAFIYRKSGDSAWEKLNGGLPQPLPHMPYALLTDRDAPGHLYAGFSNGDIWHTADYGDHWQQLPLNMGSIFTAMIML